MNTLMLKENLKLYNPLKNRRLLFSYIIAIDVLFFCLSGIHTGQVDLNNIYPVRPMLFVFFSIYIWGGAAVLPQIDLLIKPQFLCLPGSQKIMKNALLTVGFFVILLCSLVVMPFSNPGSAIWIIRIISTPVLGLPFYLLAIVFSFYFRADAQNNRLVKYGTYLLVILAIAVGIMIGDYSISLKDLVIYWVIPLTISSIALLTALAKMFGKFDIIRKYHTGTYIPWLAVVLNRDNQLDIAPRKADNDESKENIAEKYLFNGMKQRSFLSLKRSILGAIYQKVEQKIDFETASKNGFQGKIILSICILLLTGYFPVFSHNFSGNIFYIAQLYCLLMPCLVVNGILSITAYELLLPAGRFEHFIIHKTITSLKLAAGVIYVGFIIAVSWALKWIMPEITLFDQNYIYTPISTALLLWTVVFLSAVEFFSFYAKRSRSENMYIHLTLILAFILPTIFLVIIAPRFDLLMVTLIFLLFTVMDIIQHASYWLKRDLL